MQLNPGRTTSGPQYASGIHLILDDLAPSKINLGLHVLRKRPDGYHDLETVFLRLPWSDRITVQPANTITMTCSDPGLPVDERNLCMRAAQLLADTFKVSAGAEIHLEKRIPYGAGLGGGSSDAATTLRLLAELWNLEARPEQLHALAAGLGSDVPFFLGPPVAYATGRGERLAPLVNPDGSTYVFPFYLVVVAPAVEVSTARAYSLVTPRSDERPTLPEVVLSNDLGRWRNELVNDFGEPIRKAYPVIEAVERLLEEAGAGYVSLSGSGSAVFGVFEDDVRASAAAEAARLSGHRVWRGTV